MSNNNLTIGVVLAIVIAVAAFFHGGAPKAALFGSTSCSDTTCLTGGLRILTGALESNGTFQVGASGTSVARINSGFCNIQASANTITASSTKAVDCVNVAGTAPGTALTGITVGDRCFLGAATTTSPNASSGILITGASASSTAGFITANLFAYGGTFTWTAAASSSWPYYCIGS